MTRLANSLPSAERWLQQMHYAQELKERRHLEWEEGMKNVRNACSTLATERKRENRLTDCVVRYNHRLPGIRLSPKWKMIAEEAWCLGQLRKGGPYLAVSRQGNGYWNLGGISMLGSAFTADPLETYLQRLRDFHDVATFIWFAG